MGGGGGVKYRHASEGQMSLICVCNYNIEEDVAALNETFFFFFKKGETLRILKKAT